MKWVSLKQVSRYSGTSKPKKLLSAVLFTKNSYIKKTYGVVQNVSSTRELQFRKSLRDFAERIASKDWDKEIEIVIFINRKAGSVYKEELQNLIEAGEKANVRAYVYEYKIIPKNINALDKIGTLVRLIPVFSPGTILSMADHVYVIDMDSYYTDKYLSYPIPKKADVFNFEAVSFFGMYGTFLSEKEKQPFVNMSLGVFRPWHAKEFIDFPVYFRELRSLLLELDAIRAGLFDDTIDTDSYLTGPFGIDEIVVNDIIRRYNVQKYSVYLASKTRDGKWTVFDAHKFTDRLSQFLKVTEYEDAKTIKNLEQLRFASPGKIQFVLNPLIKNREEVKIRIPRGIYDGLIRLYNLVSQDEKMTRSCIESRYFFIPDTLKYNNLMRAGFVL